ncbi:MAG: PhzF family phenazine biosynthesis protein [Actinomycetota bacterium]
MTERRYRVVDVFAEQPPAGNPLAVVLDGDGLTTEQMQAYANWTNLSETTFLLPPTDPAADYHVRIFTPAEELPFAGHPTLGSCRAWLDAGGEPKTAGTVVQECGAGLVPLRVDGDRQAFLAPPLTRSGPVDDDDLTRTLAELGLDAADVVDAAWIDNGPGWLGLLLPSAEAVLAVEPGTISEKIGLIGFHPDGHEAAYEVRAFFSVGAATLEDPVTGSLNASAAQWLVETGRIAPPYLATQGTAIGRSGRITITGGDGGGADGGGPEIWVGGAASIVVSGTVEL